MLHAESETGSWADFVHTHFLKPDVLEASVFKRAEISA
jgi:hypothetical protein